MRGRELRFSTRVGCSHFLEISRHLNTITVAFNKENHRRKVLLGGFNLRGGEIHSDSQTQNTGLVYNGVV